MPEPSPQSVLQAPPKQGLGAAVIGAMAVVAVIVFGVSSLRAAGATDGPQGATPTPVETFEADYLSAANVATLFPGVVTARRESDLGFETGGRVAEVLVDVGDRVEAGQRLAALDTRALEAQLAAAQAQAVEAQAGAEIAETTLSRQRTLLDRGHISQQRLDEAAASARAARAAAQSARAAAQAVSVQLDLARLTAPFDGVITRRLVDEGAVIAPGAPLVRLVETGALEIRVGLSASRAAALRPGERYAFETPAGEIDARLRAVTGVIETNARTVSAVFDLDQPGGVSPGDVVRLSLDGEIGRRGFWAPLSALSEARRGLWSVYALVDDGAGAYTLEPRTVELLNTDGDRVYITGAVQDGDLLLAAGLQRVAPGVRVRPADEAGAP